MTFEPGDRVLVESGRLRNKIGYVVKEAWAQLIVVVINNKTYFFFPGELSLCDTYLDSLWGLL